METQFSIMIFSWNASGLKFCETLSQSEADQKRNGVLKFIGIRKPCIVPNFFENIRNEITTRNPGLVIMVTEEEDIKGSYFHSDVLQSSLPEIGYSLLKFDELDNVGETASGVHLNNVQTGDPSGSALRISIYGRNDTIDQVQMDEKRLNKFFGNNGQGELTCIQNEKRSGAIVSYIWHKVYGKFAFIATHLPSGKNSINVGRHLDYDTFRAVNKATNTLCLISILNEFVDSLPKEYKPDHVFLLGDLNYDIVVQGRSNVEIAVSIANNITSNNLKAYQQYDELKQNITSIPLNGFKEGIGNQGPIFLPTWRLIRNRSDNCAPGSNVNKLSVTCFSPESETLGGIGWHDRILYKELGTSFYKIECTAYNRLDIKNMHSSDHAGLIGIFEMQPLS